MTYLVDTDYVADYLGGMSWAQELLQAHASEGLSISLMTLGEIYEGIEYGRDPQAAERVFRTFLSGVTVLSFSGSLLAAVIRIHRSRCLVLARANQATAATLVVEAAWTRLSSSATA